MGGRRITGGGILLLAGGFFGKQTLSYLWDGVLNIFSAGMGRSVTFATFPLANAIGVALMFLGLGVVFWPGIQRAGRALAYGTHDRLPQLDEASVRKIVTEHLPTVGAEGADKGELERHVGALTSSVREFRGKYEPLLERLDLDYRRSKASMIAESLVQRKKEKPTSISFGIGGRPSRPKGWLINYVDPAHGLRELGVSEAEINAAREQVRDNVLRNGSFGVLGAGEDKIWIDGAEKQRWHLYNADLDALISILRERGWL